MNADFLAVLEFWEREKGINRDVLVAAVHEALLTAAKKAVGPARDLRVAIDQKNGDIHAFIAEIHPLVGNIYAQGEFGMEQLKAAEARRQPDSGNYLVLRLFS